MSELVRRIDEDIYDEDEFERALAWVKQNCKEGKDYNPALSQKSAARPRTRTGGRSSRWRMIVRDLMVGNPRLAELGFGEEALGHNAILGGFQGQRAVDRPLPQRRLHWRPSSTRRSTGTASACRTCWPRRTTASTAPRCCSATCSPNTAQIFADVRTYWSPEAVKRVTGHTLTGPAAGGLIHLINSGAATLDGTGEQTRDGKPAMKPFWEISDDEAKKCLEATTWPAAVTEYFRGGGFSSCYLSRGRHADDDEPHQPGPGPRTRPPDRRGVVGRDPGRGPPRPQRAHQPHLADDLVRAASDRLGAVHGRLLRHEPLGRQSRRHQLRPHRRGPDRAGRAMLRIPVAMHNVPEARIFRPSAWGLFGAQDPQGADYRACANFGPIYG